MRRYKLTMMNDCSHLCDVDGVSYFEHPEFGGEGHALAVYKDVFFDSGFYGPFNKTDTEYVKENYNEAKDKNEVTEWERYE